MKKAEFTRRLSQSDIIVIVCVPVADLPDLPMREPTLTYVQDVCACGRAIWLGTQSRDVARANPEKTDVSCAYCAVGKYGVGVLTNMTQVSKIER
jgi:hypothetical protein